MSGVTVQTRMASRSAPEIPRALECALAGCHGHIRGGDFGTCDMALAYAGAFDDPLVVGVHHLGQIFIGQDIGRDITAHGADLGGWQKTLLQSARRRTK